MIDASEVITKILGETYDTEKLATLQREILQADRYSGITDVSVAYVSDKVVHTHEGNGEQSRKESTVFKHVPPNSFAASVDVLDGDPIVLYCPDSEFSSDKKRAMVSIVTNMLLFESITVGGKITKFIEYKKLSKGKTPRTININKIPEPEVTPKQIPLGEFVFIAGTTAEFKHNVNYLFRTAGLNDKKAAANTFGYRTEYQFSSSCVMYIDGVTEFNSQNRRLAMGTLMGKHCFYYAEHTDPLYDYLDKGRTFSVQTSFTKDKNTVKNVEVVGIFDLDIPTSMLYYETIDFEKISRDAKQKKSPTMITQDVLLQYMSAESVANKKQEIIQNKLVEKLKNKKFPINIGGLQVKENGFSYDTMSVESDDPTITNIIQMAWRNMVVSFEHRVERVKYNQRFNRAQTENTDYRQDINFNSMYDQLMARVASHIHNWRWRTNAGLSLKVNNILIDVEAVHNGRSKQYKINGTRINHRELEDCITRSLCYQNQEDYDQFIKIVSKCSLEIHKLVSSGITSSISVRYNFRVLVEYRFRRIKNKNYLEIKDKLVKVNNLPSLAKKLSRCRNVFNLCDVFESGRYFPDDDLTEDDVYVFLEDGQEKYLNAIAKSEKLLSDAVKITGAKELKGYKFGGLEFRQAYEVEGVSGNSYIISESRDSHTGNCNVYRKIESENRAEYICIVDRSLGDQVGKDKLVNRLYALKNDTHVVNDIHTLAAHV